MSPRGRSTPMSEPSIETRKDALRQDLRARLDKVTDQQRQDWSLQAAERLVQLDAFRHATNVMVYLPLRTEIDTTAIVLRAFELGHAVCSPKVDWARRDMHAVELHSMADDSLELDEHGVRTPRDGRPVVPSTIDLVIVPGLAFDLTGRRLGRGGGFYDRFLSRLRRSTKTIGLAFDVQIVAEVPTEPGDVQVDLVITDRRIGTGYSSRSSH